VGVSAGIGYRPKISQNVMSNNVAVDENVAHSLGNGGGISVYGFGTPPVVITRNLISGNTTDSEGAGIYIGDTDVTAVHPIASITNNEIRGNRAGRRGGGVSTYYATVSVVNSTIVWNSAVSRGGSDVCPRARVAIVAYPNH